MMPCQFYLKKQREGTEAGCLDKVAKSSGVLPEPIVKSEFNWLGCLRKMQEEDDTAPKLVSRFLCGRTMVMHYRRKGGGERERILQKGKA